MHLTRTGRLQRSRRVLVLVAIVVAAALMLWFALRREAAPPGIIAESAVPVAEDPVSRAPATPATDSPEPNTAAAQSATATVLLKLEQATDDATGRDFGQQVYEEAREELRRLPGVVLVDANADGSAAPDVRITYTNLAKSGLVAVRGRGPPDPASEGLKELAVQAEMVFKVEARPPGVDVAGAYQTVFRSGSPPPRPGMAPSVPKEAIVWNSQETQLLASSAGLSVRPASALTIPADCVRQRNARCPYTAADIAAFTVLSWHLQTTSPDAQLVERLHAMLREPSSPPGLWLMALANLHKYKKLRLDVPELLSAWERVGREDPMLGAGLIDDVLEAGSRVDLMRQVRDLMLTELPDQRRPAGSSLRTRLVMLLATDLEDEPGARNILHSVADADPDPDVRDLARSALTADADK